MKIARRFDRRSSLRTKSRAAKQNFIRRAFRVERLEERSLLAGDLSSFYNFVQPTDVNVDGFTAPDDALAIINSLNTYGARTLPQGAEGESIGDMIDVNGDGTSAPDDALIVINRLNNPESAPPDANDVVNFILVAVPAGAQAVSTTGVLTPSLTTVQNNSEFDLVAVVDDLRTGTSNRGVFAAFADIHYEEDFAKLQVSEVQIATVNGSGTFTLTFSVPGQGNVTTAAITADAGDPNVAAANMQTELNAVLGAGATRVYPVEDGGNQYFVWFAGRPNINYGALIVGNTTGGVTVDIVHADSPICQPPPNEVFPCQPSGTNTPRAAHGDINDANSFREAFRPRDILGTASIERSFYNDAISADKEADTTVTNGELIDEVGLLGRAGQALGTVAREYWRVRVKATLPAGNTGTGTGEIVFRPDFGLPNVPPTNADAFDNIDRPAHNTLVYALAGSEDQFVDPDKIAFNTLVLDIQTGPIAAGAVNVNVNENAQNVDINVLASVSDNPGAPVITPDQIELLSIGPVSAGGSAVINTKGTADKSDDTVTFSTTGDANGQVTFTYTAQVEGNTDVNQQVTGTVTVTVAAINDAPTINDPADITINEDAPTTVNLTGIGPGGGVDEAGQTLTVTATSDNPSLIASPVTVNYTSGSTGTVTFTPAANATGTANITVTVKDSGGTVGTGSDDSTSVTFQVTVNALNDAPENRIGGAAISGANNSVVAPGATFTFTGATQLSVSDVDAGTNNITTVLSLPAGQGTLDVATIGTTDTSASGGVTITGDRTNSVTLTGPQASINTALSSVVYTPGTGFTATLTMTSTDNANATTASTINISRDPGVRPFAVDDNAGPIDEGVTTPLPIDVLGNDFRQSGANTIVTGVTQPAAGQGTVAFTPTGVTYTPPGGEFSGTVTFTYTIDDDDSNTNATLDERTGNVTVVIRAVNDAPVANDDAYSTAIGETLTVTANGTPKGVLFNDTDVDGDTLIAVNPVIASGQGSVTLSPDGGFVYTPPAGGGDFTFTYTVRDRPVGDANGQTDTATVRIHVAAPPAVTNSAVTATEDTNLPISIAANYSDPTESRPLGSVQIVTNVPTAAGVVTVAPDGKSFIYDPADNFNTTRPPASPTSFTYRAIADDGRQSNIGTVAITVTEVNDPPTANDDDFLAVRQQSGIGIDQVVPVKANDTDAPDGGGETLTVTGVSATGAAGTFTAGPISTPGGGSVKVVGGQVLYTSPTTLPVNGDDSFFYILDDGRGGSSTDTAKVNVEVVDFVPKAITGTVYIDSNGDGIQGSGEAGLSGVEVRLDGVAFDGTQVHLVAFSDIDGNYVFPQEPGQPGVEDDTFFIKPPNAAGYTITEITPWGLLSGLETENSPIVTNPDRDDNMFNARWDVTDSSGDINGLNFGIAGIDFTPAPQGGPLANAGGFKNEFLSSSGHNGFVLAVDLTNSLDSPMWSYTLDDSNISGDAWANAVSIQTSLSSDLSSLTLRVTDRAGTVHTRVLGQGYTIPGSTARFRVLATGTQGQYIIRIDASPNGDGNPSNGLEDGMNMILAAAAVEAPEGEAVNQDYAGAADAIFSERGWA